jgi:hypothetical protein
MKFVDITEQKFGKLTVMWAAGRQGLDILWMCACECGNYVIRTKSKLNRDKSCGCWRREVTTKRNTIHGYRKSHPVEYRAYLDARNRCTRATNERFKDYGGRGIQFQFSNFEQFLSELGLRPKGTSLDRIDNDSHYMQGSVRWATPSQQANNRRTNTAA